MSIEYDRLCKLRQRQRLQAAIINGLVAGSIGGLAVLGWILWRVWS